jgi:nucleoside-diphosphate-sugar epimerase
MSNSDSTLPDSILDVPQLEELLSRPSPAAIDAMGRLDGDVILLGAGGKMGPSLSRMFKRAADECGIPRRIIAVSRFSNTAMADELNTVGVETIAGDLLDENFVTQLPQIPNVVFMTGAKFGTSSGASFTWAMNTWLPSVIGQHFRSCDRMLAFSTGNVYPFVPVNSGGSIESDELLPVGEYGMSALGRERIFEYFAQRFDFPLTIVRLNYAVEMRYGVLLDLAQKVASESPIDQSMGFANVIWQADANAMTIAALADATAPPFVINVAGPEIFSVEDVCNRFGSLFGTSSNLIGKPSETALLNNAELAQKKYGVPSVSLDQIVQWTADWIRRGGETLRKPTHFEVRDGRF